MKLLAIILSVIVFSCCTERKTNPYHPWELLEVPRLKPDTTKRILDSACFIYIWKYSGTDTICYYGQKDTTKTNIGDTVLSSDSLTIIKWSGTKLYKDTTDVGYLSFSGLYFSKTVIFTDSTGMAATVDSAGNWTLYDTMATIKTLYELVHFYQKRADSIQKENYRMKTVILEFLNRDKLVW